MSENMTWWDFGWLYHHLIYYTYYITWYLTDCWFIRQSKPFGTSWAWYTRSINKLNNNPTRKITDILKSHLQRTTGQNWKLLAAFSELSQFIVEVAGQALSNLSCLQVKNNCNKLTPNPKFQRYSKDAKVYILLIWYTQQLLVSFCHERKETHTHTGTHLSIFRLLNFCLCLSFFLLLLCDLRLSDAKLRINLLIYLQIHINHFCWGVLTWVNCKVCKGKFEEGWKIWPQKPRTQGSTRSYKKTLCHAKPSYLLSANTIDPIIEGWIRGCFLVTWNMGMNIDFHDGPSCHLSKRFILWKPKLEVFSSILLAVEIPPSMGKRALHGVQKQDLLKL